MQSRLTVVPCDLARANAFVAGWHRHHRPVVSYKFALGVADESGTVRGVAIVGRPVARMIEDGWTLEVNRLATDGCENACSALYGAAWRVTRQLGYRRLLTYILESEPGVSLRASGWRLVGAAGGGSWSRPSRPSEDNHPLCIKQRWEVTVESALPFGTVTWPIATETAQLSLPLE